MNISGASVLYFLGPTGTYAEIAARQFISELNINTKQILPLLPITEILKITDKNNDSIAVLPIENSIEGIVRETIDNLVRINDNSLKITAETVIPVNHCLLSKSTRKEEITAILSYTQALRQCSDSINKNFPDAEIIESSSTAAAAREAALKGKGYAAIAGAQAASIFGLNILDSGINDEKDNKTRFILLSRTVTEPTGHDKTGISFSLKNEPGALFEALKVFSDRNINLLYIDSRPSRKKMGEYTFYVDFEGHSCEKNVTEALCELQKHTDAIFVTGSYARYEF